MIDPKLDTTAVEFPCYRILRNLGAVRGIIVRSRISSAPSVPLCNITLYTDLCEQAREDAHRLMVEHAAQLGADAIIGARCDATELTGGVTEVLAYGSAVCTEIHRRSRAHARDII